MARLLSQISRDVPNQLKCLPERSEQHSNTHGGVFILVSARYKSDEPEELK
ncbi:hypothetical protein DPMN_117987 [Dreissena polymorpha]|uniref:Uncharacterized protein n=1 Tax=Dreissena polymorpha TaxID=45954 RepID=A0A9D4JL95_DREPO|nr:hypothetical protein DPMN_117987 [Dreissena polymorpha]